MKFKYQFSQEICYEGDVECIVCCDDSVIYITSEWEVGSTFTTSCHHPMIVLFDFERRYFIAELKMLISLTSGILY